MRRGEGEETVIGVDRRAGDGVRRSDTFRCRRVQPRTSPAATRALPRATRVGPVRLHVLVDATSVEVFADGGRAVLTDQIFPKPDSRGVSLFATGGEARLRSLEAWELRP